MYGNNGFKYNDIQKEYLNLYSNKTKNILENKSNLKRNGELLINNNNYQKPFNPNKGSNNQSNNYSDCINIFT